MTQTIETDKSSISRKQWIIVITMIAIVAIFGLWLIKEGSTGTLAIKPVGQKAEVYIDQQQQKSLQPTSTATFRTSSGTAEVLIGAANAYPWKETVTISPGTTTEIKPFLIPQQPRLARNPPEKIVTKLSQSETTDKNRLSVTRNNVTLSVEDNQTILAQWTGEPNQAPNFFTCDGNNCSQTVYTHDEDTISQLSFYPNRSDVAIFATADGIYAIEIDPTGATQNFQPILTDGDNPRYVITNDVIFIRSDNRLFASQL